jgi:O-antigen/teichoic acid export membrane protein
VDCHGDRTILAGILALTFFPFPFLTAPIFFSVWFLSMDIVPFLFGKAASWEQKCWISLCFGFVMLVIGFMLDRKKRGDYAFWSYLFGTLAFWGGLNCLVWTKGEVSLFIYLIINLMMMCFSILVRRHVLMIFGAIGVFAYLSHLAYNVFEDSILFPFALSFIGLVIIYLGILYQRNFGWIEKKMYEKLPPRLRVFFDEKQ